MSVRKQTCRICGKEFNTRTPGERCGECLDKGGNGIGRPGNVGPVELEQRTLSGIEEADWAACVHGLESDAGFAADIEFLKADMEPATVRSRIEEYDGHAEIEKVVKADLANAEAVWSGLRETLAKAEHGVERTLFIALLIAAFIAGFGVALILIGVMS